MVLSRGASWVFVTHLRSAMLLLLALTVLVLTVLPAVRREREEVFTE